METESPTQSEQQLLLQTSWFLLYAIKMLQGDLLTFVVNSERYPVAIMKVQTVNLKTQTLLDCDSNLTKDGMSNLSK